MNFSRGHGPSPRRRVRGFVVTGTLLIALAVTGAVALLAALALVVAGAWYWNDLPPLDKATDYRPRQHLQVLTADGKEIAQFGTERRIFVPIEQMPVQLKQAVIAVEDTGFYEHNGISWRGVARAAWSNATGGVGGGASTITQQVSRTFFLSTRRTAERKIKEALIAWRLEDELTKDEILELYLNQIYLGQRAYGYGAAAQVYFGKPLAQLNLAEISMLAGLQQNPIHANPVVNEGAATRRQHWVLARMKRTGAITADQHDEAVMTRLSYRSPRFVDVHAQHVAEMARRAVVDLLGEKAYTEGVRVVTSLRSDDQRAAHSALRRAAMAHERKQRWRGPEDQETLPDHPAQADRAAALALKDGRDDEDLRLAIVLQASPQEVTAKLASGETVTVSGTALRWVQAALKPGARDTIAIRRGSVLRLVLTPPTGKGRQAQWTIAQWPQANGAYVALDPATGRVRAMVGGFSFGRQQFNRATSAARQPGSAFKPFLYSAALEHGLMPETLVNDAPLTSYDGGSSSWNPQNSDGKFDGPITVREGLVRSKNLVSVRLLQQLGLPAARDWIERFGFDMKQHPQDLTLALGSGSSTPLQMALAYAVLANGGHRVAPVLIERILGPQGQVLFEAPPPEVLSEDNRVVPARNVFMVNTLLRDVTARGTAAQAQAQLKRPDLQGKTGTTNDAVDAWFAGWAPGVVGVAWMGFDEPRSLGAGESGGGLALPIWIDSMSRALNGVPVQALVAPDGVV
ncbi:MAG: PBP1A family penicillin-binding protein, partial [Rubrivivax sp.]|nr:PBP1A family penicillin-binding protein [Rubrivivax sp.]